jgi:hypothetical protein
MLLVVSLAHALGFFVKEPSRVLKNSHFKRKRWVGRVMLAGGKAYGRIATPTSA